MPRDSCRVRGGVGGREEGGRELQHLIVTSHDRQLVEQSGAAAVCESVCVCVSDSESESVCVCLSESVCVSESESEYTIPAEER